MNNNKSRSYKVTIFIVFEQHNKKRKTTKEAYLFSKILALKWSMVTKSGKKGKMSSIFSLSHSCRNSIALAMSFSSSTTCRADGKTQLSLFYGIIGNSYD